MAADQDGARDAGWFAVSVGVIGDPSPARWVGVTAPPALAKELRELPDGTRVQINGPIDRLTRTMLLGTVTPQPMP